MDYKINSILTLLNGDRHYSATREAEIYHAEVSTEDSLYYLALCYFKSGKVKSACHILTKAECSQAKCKLLLGKCAFELGEYHKAEMTLLGNDINIEPLINAASSSNSNNSTSTTNNTNSRQSAIIREQLIKFYGDNASAAFAAEFIGMVFEKTLRPKLAIEFFRISLELLPSWSPAEALARLTDRTSNFNSRSNLLASALTKVKPNETIKHHSIIDSLNSTSLQYQPIYTATSDNPTTASANNNTSNTNEKLATPMDVIEEYKTPQTRRLPPAKRTRSNRLYSIENNNETPATRPTIGQGTAHAPAKKNRRIESSEANLDPMGKVFLDCIKALDYLNHYKLDQCIDVLNSLPDRHRNTGWVLCCLGRALYEKTKYQESVNHYEAARRLEPYRLEGMEYYSSSLWHLHKEVELSILAKDLMAFDQDAPQTWCVAGNCYSLQKEHETAIKYLERAIKVDPNFAYAYTLLGHELISAERLDQAMTCFRTATRLDPRHWNAWCGLGCIYYKNEVYSSAELYYKKALKIAPTNPVLMCQLAVVQHACKRSDSAIDTLSKALAIDPDNALCRFHRATIYSAIDKNKEALIELDELKNLVPKESMVYFLIGKIHKKTGSPHTALMNFSWAMELDPKGANNQIRDVIDKQHSGEEDVVVHRDQSVES